MIELNVQDVEGSLIKLLLLGIFLIVLKKIRKNDYDNDNFILYKII